MKQSTRVLTFLIIVEAGIAALWWWLIASLKTGDLRPSGSMAHTISTVSSTLGGVMGVIAGVLLVVWFFLRRSGK
jgi:cytosine/uracil/thiamine/allantoin permease